MRQLHKALGELAHMPKTTLLRHSSFYSTPPWGPIQQADFINAVAEIHTQLSARQLLEELLAIERRAGRVRGEEQWGPRIIDLDLLLHGDSRIDEEGLCVPHPHMLERAFVLVPLAELSPASNVPECGLIAVHLARLDASVCQRIPGSADL